MAARDFPFLDWPGPIPFAHRGGASESPENTLPAFEYAVGLGYRYLETDVHVTADGVLLAFHDDVLDRVTDRQGVIAELPWAEVRLALVDGREPIPRFDDLLGAWPDARLNVDPKHDAAADPLAEAIERAGALQRVCVGAFDDARIDRLRARLGPRLCTSPGPAAIADLVRVARNGPGAADAGAALAAPCLQVPPRFGDVEIVTDAFVGLVHDAGGQVHVWTIDEPDEMRRLLDIGVDGIMTDRPAVLRDLLIDRGQWHEA
jgi:glycerophosphoryl diester phosphodiesterase